MDDRYELADGDYQLLPPLADDEYEHLKADIEERGVLVPIEFDEHGNILDGHHRYAACIELGITDYPKTIREGMTEAEKRSHARTLNMARRHMSREERRWMIADELRENPTKSNNAIAKMLQVSDVTVASVRNELGLKTDQRVGDDGKVYKIQQDKATPYKNEVFQHRLIFDTAEERAEYVEWLKRLKRTDRPGLISQKVLDFIREYDDT